MSDAPLMLSVSGLRGLIGKSLTPDVAARYAAAVGNWFAATKPDGGPPHVVLGRDSRPSGPMIEHAAMAGLIAAGCRVTRLGIATTPGVAIMARQLGANGGMVITASHNPIIWNGIKVLRRDGVAPPPDQAQAIIDRFTDGHLEYAPVEQLQPAADDHSLCDVHAKLILDRIDVDAIAARPIKIVLDSVHGAGGPETMAMLRPLGVDVVHLYGEPTGQFPHTPEPTRENLVGLSQAVRKHGADIGFAQDPDADRLAIVDEQGTYIGEEYTLALAALHMVSRAGSTGNIAMAANLSTSRMLDDIAAKAGGMVIRTPVGEANVAEGMKSGDALIGGEGNGGVIWPEISYVRDSLVGIALMLEMLARRGKALSEITAEIPAYAIVKEKAPFDDALARSLADRMRQAFKDQRIDMQDGVRVDWPDRWVHVRPSNTEPILRIIAEAGDEAAARQLVDQVRQALGI